MLNKLKAALEAPSCYDDSEVNLMRQQLKKGNAEALAHFTAEKYPLDPRIVAAREAAAKAKS